MSEASAEIDRAAKGEDGAHASLLRSGLNFLHEFALFAGWTGVWAALLVCGGALLENVGILLLIPFLSLSMDNAEAGTWVEAHVGPVLALLHAETRFARLAVLLGVFVSLLALRAAMLSA